MPSGSRDQWNLIRVESWAASILAKLSETFLDGLAFCVSIAASPNIISVPKKHKTRI